MKNFLDDLIIELDKGIKSSLSNRQEYERAYPAESIHEAEPVSYTHLTLPTNREV